MKYKRNSREVHIRAGVILQGKAKIVHGITGEGVGRVKQGKRRNRDNNKDVFKVNKETF